MNVAQLITGAFRLAAARYPELYEKWIKLSFRVGSLLPNSLLFFSIQKCGELDMVLRCMEDDFTPPQADTGDLEMLSFTYQSMLSELWVGSVYEIFRLLKSRKLVDDNVAFRALEYDLRLLRVTLEKHEIAADYKLSEPLVMQRQPSKEGERDCYQYLKSDQKRSHIMPSGVSRRGSLIWHVIDVSCKKSYWLERRALSERIVALWAPLAEQDAVPDGTNDLRERPES
jgi:hypothetical protein